MRLRMKNFNIMGVHRKIQFSEGRFTKKQYIGGNCLKRGGGTWTACRFKEGAWKKSGWGGIFEGG